MKRALLLGVFVSACAASQGAPIDYGQHAPARRVEARAPVRVHRQDTSTPAPDWADGPGTPLSAFATPPYDNDPAHPPRTHRVALHESIYDIAAAYQMPVNAIAEQNHLTPPYRLAPGRVIELPPPRLHRVERGETFEDIAQRYSVDTRSLALMNRMSPPYVVREGDEIVLPAVASDRFPPPFTGEVPSEARGRGDDAPPSVAQRATAPPQAGEQTVAPNVHFAWPLRGDVVARFGAQPGGARLDGVEIAGEEGATIGAAGDGEVVYAGEQLHAYGTLVLVRHDNGYVTAYAYARRALVREGQHVRAGQAIAELGPRPQGPPRLLFQVRHGREAIDPMPLLGGG